MSFDEFRQHMPSIRWARMKTVTAFDCGDEDADEPTRLLYFDLNDLDED